MPIPRDARDADVATYHRTAGRLANRLRAMADEVDRHTEPRPGVSILHRRGSFTSAAAEIVDDVTSGLINLRLGDLVRDAATVDAHPEPTTEET
ncbi:MAG TPA: hypothetical protein VK507_19175 [Iamia sp.]|nr:hypothetical protein [Iamia sp.]